MQPPTSGIKNKEFKWDKYRNMIAFLYVQHLDPGQA